MQEGLTLTATAHVKLTKYDEHGNVIDTVESDTILTPKEVEAICRSQMQE